ncbi:CDPF1 protein, partial [Pardalotus punctatus]|nr:CDPF1 protein [Pardalotus punctatus]
MDAPKEVQTAGEFKCDLCEFSAPYMYYGQMPPNSHSVVLLEETCVMKDPFSPDKDKFLIVGSHCSLCSRAVGIGTNCSLFYSWVKENLKAFPLEIQEDMDRRKTRQKSCKEKDTKH